MKKSIKKILLPIRNMFSKLKFYIGQKISNRLNEIYYYHHFIFGPKNRAKISKKASINNCLLNTNSGDIYMRLCILLT